MTEGSRVPVTAVAPLGRSFWLLLSASGTANIADGLLRTAVPLVAVTFTRDPRLVALIATLATLPWLVFALPIGAIIDRVDRRFAIGAANVVRAAVVLGVAGAIWADLGSIWLLLVGAFVVGTAEVIADTAGQTLLPQVVGPEQLSRANSRLYGVEMAANSFIGPPLGGLLVAGGAALAFAMPGAAWLVAVGLLVMIPGRFQVERAAKTSIATDIAEGLRFLFGHTTLRALAAMTGLFNLGASMLGAVFVLYAVGPASPMGLTEVGYGALLTATAGGAVLGSMLAPHLERRLGRFWSLGAGSAVGTLTTAGVGLSTNPWVIGALWVVGGVFIMLWNVVVVSLRQSLTPPGLLGRVNSSYRLLAWGTLPIGAVLGGFSADAFGLRTTFFIAAAVTGLCFALLPTIRGINAVVPVTMEDGVVPPAAGDDAEG